MPEEIGLFEAMYTQRAIRYYKADPIPDDLIRRLIERATKAPSGSNRQSWRFVVIRDRDLKRRIGEYYRRTWDDWSRGPGTSGDVDPRVRSSAAHLAEHIHESPVLILAYIEHDGGPSSLDRGASIYPAVQNLLLAARGLGLGSVITTFHRDHEREIKELLGIPNKVETAALLPVGYPVEGAGYGPTRRRPVEKVICWDRWGNPD